MFDNFFRKKIKLTDLEKAKNEGLITEVEFLRLKKDRAIEDLKIYESKKIKKK